MKLIWSNESPTNDDPKPYDSLTYSVIVKAELIDPNLLVEMTFTAAAGEKFQS